ncbi:hypothetical protein GJAV_G00143650 [Gymnothorax javanicus]|nr:hypothetical protein GJAV_G00143650 [Gymnothorax javanicus]
MEVDAKNDGEKGGAGDAASPSPSPGPAPPPSTDSEPEKSQSVLSGKKRALCGDAEKDGEKDGGEDGGARDGKRQRVEGEELEAQLELKITANTSSRLKLEKVVQQLVEEQLRVLQLSVFDRSLQELKERVEKIDCATKHQQTLNSLQAKIARLTKKFGAANQTSENMRKTREGTSHTTAVNATPLSTTSSFRSVRTPVESKQPSQNQTANTVSATASPAQPKPLSTPTPPASSPMVSAPVPLLLTTATASDTAGLTPVSSQNQPGAVLLKTTLAGSAVSQSGPTATAQAVTRQPLLIQLPLTVANGQGGGASMELIPVSSLGTVGTLAKAKTTSELPLILQKAAPSSSAPSLPSSPAVPQITVARAVYPPGSGIVSVPSSGASVSTARTPSQSASVAGVSSSSSLPVTSAPAATGGQATAGPPSATVMASKTVPKYAFIRFACDGKTLQTKTSQLQCDQAVAINSSVKAPREGEFIQATVLGLSEECEKVRREMAQTSPLETHEESTTSSTTATPPMCCVHDAAFQKELDRKLQGIVDDLTSRFESMLADFWGKQLITGEIFTQTDIPVPVACPSEEQNDNEVRHSVTGPADTREMATLSDPPLKSEQINDQVSSISTRQQQFSNAVISEESVLIPPLTPPSAATPEQPVTYPTFGDSRVWLLKPYQLDGDQVTPDRLERLIREETEASQYPTPAVATLPVDGPLFQDLLRRSHSATHLAKNLLFHGFNLSELYKRNVSGRNFGGPQKTPLDRTKLQKIINTVKLHYREDGVEKKVLSDNQATNSTGSKTFTQASRAGGSRAVIDLTEDDDDVQVTGVQKAPAQSNAASTSTSAPQHSAGAPPPPSSSSLSLGPATGSSMRSSPQSGPNSATGPNLTAYRSPQNSPSNVRTTNTNASPHQLPPLPSPPPAPSRLPPEATHTSPPQRPQLKLTRVQNQNGIVLSWGVDEPDRTCAAVDSYHLYAYHRDHAGAPPSQWKKIGEVKALPLPMACTLTQFVAGSTYYFAICARDIYSRFGPFCEPQCTDVINTTSSG